MPRLTLDGSDLPVPDPGEPWCATLARVDAALAPRALIVTDVRFDGIDEPAFREPGLLGRPVSGYSLVEVLSGTPTSLMERCLAEAADSLGVLAENALRVGDEFRRRDVASARLGLASLADGLGSLVGIVGAAGLALKVDLDVITCEGRSVSSLVGEVTALIDALLAAHDRRDWNAVANILQYDIGPALRRFRPLVDVVGQALP